MFEVNMKWLDFVRILRMFNTIMTVSYFKLPKLVKQTVISGYSQLRIRYFMGFFATNSNL